MRHRLRGLLHLFRLPLVTNKANSREARKPKFQLNKKEKNQ